MSNYITIRIIILEIICLSITSHVCDSLRFELQSGSTKCIAEEIKQNAMTLGKYNVISPIDGHPVPHSHRIIARVISNLSHICCLIRHLFFNIIIIRSCMVTCLVYLNGGSYITFFLERILLLFYLDNCSCFANIEDVNTLQH